MIARTSKLGTYDRIAANEDLIWVKKRGCIHGDLNATNVAIDTTSQETPQAYIFDAAGVSADLDLRDLATLEVTPVLFNSTGADERLVLYSRPFYQDAVCPGPVALPQIRPLLWRTRCRCSPSSAIG